VLVTTHFLDEAEYCNDIILINAGRLIASGSPMALKTTHITKPLLEVTVTTGSTVEALEAVRVQPWALETSVFGTKLHVMVSDEEAGIRAIGEVLSGRGMSVARVERIVPSLEDVFLYLLDRDAQNIQAA
jgi:ABC-2 type transport system ATP-binding protein